VLPICAVRQGHARQAGGVQMNKRRQNKQGNGERQGGLANETSLRSSSTTRDATTSNHSKPPAKRGCPSPDTRSGSRNHACAFLHMSGFVRTNVRHRFSARRSKTTKSGKIEMRKRVELIRISRYHFSQTRSGCGFGAPIFFGGSMAINFVRAPEGSDDSIQFQPIERLKVYLFGATILFASFGMGEAVYRLLFSEFDGITDRIPIELLFGLVFAWLATKFVGGIYRNRKQRSARLNFIWARNHQIRGALEAINPLAHPSRNQQSIRVIREEVDRIESALKEILPG